MDGITAPERRPGDVIGGRLRLDDRLGEGAVGDVWRATHLVGDGPVAVKLLSSRLYPSRSAHHVARFLDEATIASRVKCPHVVKVMECGLSLEAGPYIVMELVEGPDLCEHLNRIGSMTVRETATVVAQLCVALEALHGANVFHRDVKPENIVLSAREDDACPVLIDFGIALDGQEAARGTQAAFLGTPPYMSPESGSRGLRAATPRRICGRSPWSPISAW
jgi:serine/threonine protein kinase